MFPPQDGAQPLLGVTEADGGVEGTLDIPAAAASTGGGDDGDGAAAADAAAPALSPDSGVTGVQPVSPQRGGGAHDSGSPGPDGGRVRGSEG